MLKKALAFVLFTIVGLLPLKAQTDIELILTQKYAENSFRDGDYEFALENYLILYEKDKRNIELNYRIGICYTETTIDKSLAIPYLEFVVGHNNYPVQSYYYLGRAYMYNYRFTEAVEALYEYKMIGVAEDKLTESDRLIKMCYDALERINYPRNVVFERLDSTINTIYDDYYPFISADNSTLVYTSRSTYVDDFEDYIANVFYSDNRKGSWEKANPLPVNTYDNETVVGMQANGEKILIYADGDYFTHDVKMVNRKGNKFSDASRSELPADLNTEGVEMGACISPDGNKLFFVSDRRGGRGGLDIYYSRKDASGQWGPSQNLGSTINTEFDDNFPSLSPDGKSLYFASKGHSGIGEYDIFQSLYIDSTNTWTPPRNLGFPINTPLDNTTISFSADGQTAYVSANRKEGFGKLDIYKINFGDESQSIILMGTVMIGTPANAVPYSEDFLKAYATLFDNFGNIIAQIPVQSEGGAFFGALFPGTYRLEVKFEGYERGHSEELVITSADTDGVFRTIYLTQ
jgi:tetratricopeptide (TPR) repeat protein